MKINKRKVIQFNVDTIPETEYTKWNRIFTALCDDGSMWMSIISERVTGGWERLPDIPQE